MHCRVPEQEVAVLRWQAVSKLTPVYADRLHNRLPYLALAEERSFRLGMHTLSNTCLALGLPAVMLDQLSKLALETVDALESCARPFLDIIRTGKPSTTLFIL